MFLLPVWLYVWLAAGMTTQTAPPADTLLRRTAPEGTPLVDRIQVSGGVRPRE